MWPTLLGGAVGEHFGKASKPSPAEYKVIVAPTRDGWRYVPQMRRGAHKAWTDFPPYRQFTSRAEAVAYVEELGE